MAQESILTEYKFMETVRICLVTKRTYAESIMVLKRVGYKVSSKTFQRAKIEIERTQKERIDQLADEFPQYAANVIDTAIAIDMELWTIVRTSKNIWEKLKALEMIAKNCKEKADYFETSPVLAKLAKKLEDRKTESEKVTAVVTETKKSEVKDDNVGKNSEARSN